MPGALARACRAVRPGGPRDAVGGLTPAWVASPADASEASALLAAATEHELAVVPRGSGTTVSWYQRWIRCANAIAPKAGPAPR